MPAVTLYIQPQMLPFSQIHSHVIYNLYIYIYKEELKMVISKLLKFTQTNRHETSTALWNPYCRVSLRGRRAQIHFSRGTRAEKPENDCLPFWFYGESIWTSMRSSHGNGGNAKVADGVVTYEQGSKTQESLLSQREFSAADAGKPKFCPNVLQ